MEEFVSPQLLKALHLVFMVSWFSGLFYIVRLFIYHVEAQSKDEVEKMILSKQYKIMQKRLWYIIGWPSMILTCISAFWMLFAYYHAYLANLWMHFKLGFVFLLIAYHIGCHVLFKQMQKDEFKYSSLQLRIWNEVATLLLFAIIFLVVYKSLDFYRGIISFIVLAVLLMFGIKLYKKYRLQKEQEIAERAIKEAKLDDQVNKIGDSALEESKSSSEKDNSQE